MIGVFDSGFGGLQTLKYLITKFPHEDFVFLADNAHVPYGNKSAGEIKKLTLKYIDILFDMGCHHVVIACNTAVSSIYKHRFSKQKEERLVSITACGVYEAVKQGAGEIAVFCTQATHDLGVYSMIYHKVKGSGTLYTIPTPELVPLLESDTLDYDKIYKYIEQYQKYLSPRTDCLILGCTHYPIIIDVFREKFPSIRIIDPGRSLLSYLDMKITNAQCKRQFGRGSVSIFCTGSKDTFFAGAKKVRKTKNLPPIMSLKM